MPSINKYYVIERVRRGKSVANEADIAQCLTQFLKRSHIDYNPYEEKVIECFKDISGQMIERFTEKIWLKNDSLYVKVALPSIKAELNMVRDAIKDEINKKIGIIVIKRIIIK